MCARESDVASRRRRTEWYVRTLAARCYVCCEVVADSGRTGGRLALEGGQRARRRPSSGVTHDPFDGVRRWVLWMTIDP
jgi:hypothetical protein